MSVSSAWPQTLDYFEMPLVIERRNRSSDLRTVCAGGGIDGSGASNGLLVPGQQLCGGGK